MGAHPCALLLCCCWSISQQCRGVKLSVKNYGKPILVHFPGACSVLINAFNENPTVQRHTMGFWLIGDSKLPLGVNASVNGCLSLYVSPASGSWPVQGIPSFLPYGRWDRPPPEKDKRREWMDGMAFKEIKKSISVTETLFRLLRDNLLFLSNLKNTLKSFYWNCFLAKKQSLF